MSHEAEQNENSTLDDLKTALYEVSSDYGAVVKNSLTDKLSFDRFKRLYEVCNKLGIIAIQLGYLTNVRAKKTG